MKFLLAFLMFFPAIAMADMVEANYGFGQGTKPFYGADYEFVKGLSYLDLSLTGNSEYVQPYVSAGLQFDHINIGLASAVAISNGSHDGSFNGQLSVGPEIGYMQNLTDLIYVKENNSYMGFNGAYNFTSTLSIGFNL